VSPRKARPGMAPAIQVRLPAAVLRELEAAAEVLVVSRTKLVEIAVVRLLQDLHPGDGD
jgi:hypothetical protein